jgi:predicted ArsR family transcriptional regulator
MLPIEDTIISLLSLLCITPNFIQRICILNTMDKLLTQEMDDDDSSIRQKILASISDAVMLDPSEVVREKALNILLNDQHQHDEPLTKAKLRLLLMKGRDMAPEVRTLSLTTLSIIEVECIISTLSTKELFAFTKSLLQIISVSVQTDPILELTEKLGTHNTCCMLNIKYILYIYKRLFLLQIQLN